jgi:hypothetical protein
MKACLDDNELLRLWAAEPGESLDHRVHLAQCPRCTASYDQLLNEAGMITSALTNGADRLHSRKSATVGSLLRFGSGLRTAAVFCGAAALGGAAAFALLIALGWHPTSASNQFASATGRALIAKTAALNPTSSTNLTIAVNETGASLGSNGSLYTVDEITSDPLNGLGYGDPTQDDNLNPTEEDLLFCVPGDDSAICDSADRQG